jgi:hypothetical protein
MDAIDGLARDLTLVLIAHRLTTVEHYDFIVELDARPDRCQGHLSGVAGKQLKLPPYGGSGSIACDREVLPGRALRSAHS